MMSIVQRVLKNTLLLLASQVIGTILGLFFIIYTARYLGAEGFGVLSYALAFSGIFGILADFGLNSLIPREIARDRSSSGKYTNNVLFIKVVLSIVTLCIIVIAINIMQPTGQTKDVVYLIALSVILSSFTGMFNAVFQAFEKMEYQSIGSVLNNLLLLLGIILVINYNYGILFLSLVYVVANFIILAYSVIICAWRFAIPRIEFDQVFLKDLMVKALPFFLTAFFSLATAKISSIMISAMVNNSDLGFYSASYRLVDALMIIPATMVASIYPVLSNFYISSQDNLRVAYQRLFKYLLILSLPIAVGVTLLSGKIISLIYGTGYEQSTIALQILIWMIPINFLSYMLGTMLASIDRQVSSLKVNVFDMLLCILLNIVFIPMYSYMGVSCVMVVTAFVSFILQYYFVSKYTYKVDIIKVAFKPVLACVIMSLFILAFNDVNIFIIIFLSVIVYFVSLIALREFTADEFVLVKGIFNRKMEAQVK